MKISVVIPVKNSETTLKECLKAVRANTFKDYEIVVVDDLSSDNSIEIAEKFGCRVVKSRSPHGVSAARNTGARASEGDVILFVDADIVIEKDSLEKLADIYRKRNPDAVVGVQSRRLRYNNFLSQFKNLWMRYTYIKQPDYVALFYTSMASIKKDVFIEAGGFDENYKIPNVEDTDFGQKLAMMGKKIMLARELSVEHLKAYNLPALLKTDYYRARGLVKMVLRNRFKTLSGGNKTSVPNNYIIQVMAFLFFIFLSTAFALSGKMVFLLPAITCFLLVLIANGGFIGFLLKEKGIAFAICAFFYIIIDNLSVISGLVTGVVSFIFSGNRYY